MRIRSKILLFVIPLAVLPLVLLGWFAHGSLTRGFEEQAQLDNQRLCLLAATGIEQILDDCREGLLLLSSQRAPPNHELNRRSLQQAIAAPEKQFANIAAQVALRHSPHVQIRLIDAAGRERFKTRGLAEADELGSALEEPIFLQAVATAEPRGSGIRQFPPQEKNDSRFSATTFSLPLLAELDLMGFLFLDLDVEAMANYLRQTARASPGYYFLYDGAGRVLAESNYGSSFHDGRTSREFAAILQIMLDNSAATFTHRAFESDRRLYSISARPVKEYIAFREPVPEERWYLGLVRSDTAMRAAFGRTQTFFWSVLTAGMLIAIAGALYFSQRITTPIGKLTGAAQNFARGHLDARVEVESKDEIGELAGDFNQMANDLEQLLRERRANETLVTIGRFSAALAHDLRSPVEGLKLLAHELNLQLDRDQPHYEIAAVIAQAADSLATLVNESLDFSRITDPALVPADAVALCEETLKSFRFDGIKLKRDFPERLPMVEMDAAQIKRVLTNLIRNAIEACTSAEGAVKPVVSLIVKMQDKKLRILVEDTGPGIPDDLEEKIFEPFFSTKIGGHGLGLAMARQIVANHGGALYFESEAGQGTTFVVELPLGR